MENYTDYIDLRKQIQKDITDEDYLKRMLEVIDEWKDYKVEEVKKIISDLKDKNKTTKERLKYFEGILKSFERGV